MTPHVVAVAMIAPVAPGAAAAPVMPPPTTPDTRGEVRLELVADGFEVLSNAAAPKSQRDVIYLLEQHTGRVRLVEDGTIAAEPVLDLGDRLIDDPWHEEGLVGLALALCDTSAMFVSYIDRRSQPWSAASA